jgi:hypothetical protein
MQTITEQKATVEIENISYVLDGMNKISKAKRGVPGYRFNRSNSKKLSTYDMEDVYKNAKDILNRYKSELIEHYLLASSPICNFNLIYSEKVGHHFQNFTLSNEKGKEVIHLDLFHYFKDYENPHKLLRKDYACVNDEIFPFEIVLLESLFSNFCKAFESIIFTGSKETNNPINGLLVQHNNNLEPASAKLNDANFLEDFEKLVSETIPEKVNSENIIWFLPNKHYEKYCHSYKTKYSEYPNMDDDGGIFFDTAKRNIKIVPTEFLTNKEHFVVSSSNVYIAFFCSILQLDYDFSTSTESLQNVFEGVLGLSCFNIQDSTQKVNVY